MTKKERKLRTAASFLIFAFAVASFSAMIFTGVSNAIVFNGGGSCGDGVCDPSRVGEDCNTCPEDCGSCGPSCTSLANGATQTTTSTTSCSIYEPVNSCGNTCTATRNIQTTSCTQSVIFTYYEYDDEGSVTANGFVLTNQTACNCDCVAQSGSPYSICHPQGNPNTNVFYSPGQNLAFNLFARNDCRSHTSGGIWGSGRADVRVTTVFCNPGYVCASDPNVCGGIQCVPGCTIGGQTYPDGTLNPSNSCQSCNIAANPYDWTNLADGSTCGTGGTCQGGVCIGYSCPNPGAPGPQFATQQNTYAGCRANQPGNSTDETSQFTPPVCSGTQRCYLCNPGYAWDGAKCAIVSLGWCADLPHPTFYKGQTGPGLNPPPTGTSCSGGNLSCYSQCCYSGSQAVPGADYTIWVTQGPTVY